VKFPTSYLTISGESVRRVLPEDQLIDWLAEKTVHAAATARSLCYFVGIDHSLPAQAWAAKAEAYVELIGIIRKISTREEIDMFVVLQACLIGDVLYPSTRERRW
jgi:hypothetical protein